MNTYIVSIDDAAIDELLDKTINTLDNEQDNILPEIISHVEVNRRFGIVDLWKIRNSKRHFSIYR